MKIIEIQNLNKSYLKPVLNNLTLNLDQGEIIAMVGVNGAGKSTLIEILCGIRKADSGKISIFNKEIKSYKDRFEIKKEIGYMPQAFCMYHDLTVKENLIYLKNIYELDGKENLVENILEKCFLTEVKDYLAKTLSGGYKQLLSLACAMIHKPKLLTLDEPTSAMDPLFRKRFWKIIKDYNKENGATVLVTTHYSEEIFECDKIMFLSKGKIIHSCQTTEIFENGKFKTITDVLNFYILKEGSYE